MLVLTRKAGETIKINDNIEVTILSRHGSQYKIGIEAPPEVVILREEVFLRGKTKETDNE
jgi:carbon storage regulator CsrA